MIAIDYYALLSIDSQIEISLSTLNVWREQVRTIEALLKVGEENENALTQHVQDFMNSRRHTTTC